MTTTDSTRDILDDLDRRDAEARAIDCGIEGCDRSYHEGDETPQHWHHRIAEHVDDMIDASVILEPAGRAYAYVVPSFNDDRYADLDGDGLRALAAKVEAVPAKLRALAAKLDERNA